MSIDIKDTISIEAIKELIEKDANMAMSIVYKSYRKEFIKFAKKYSNNQEVIIDSFQEAVISLYGNLLHGEVNGQKSTIKTYLFAIGKYKLINNIDKESRYTKIHENIEAFIPEENSTTIPDNIRKAFAQLGNSCQKILTLFYYRNYSIDAIAREMSMKNINSIKANKSRCLKKLKLIVQENK